MNIHSYDSLSGSVLDDSLSGSVLDHPLAGSILDGRDDPERLEQLFRARPDAFRAAFSEAFGAAQEDPVLRVWRARLGASAPPEVPVSVLGGRHVREGLLVVVLALLAGGADHLWSIMTAFAEVDDAPVTLDVGLFMLGALAAYYLFKQRVGAGVVAAVGLVFAGALVYLGGMPAMTETQSAGQDALVLARLHLPLFLWAMAGVAFAGDRYRDPMRRLDFLRHCADVGSYAILILLGGGALTGICVFLFEAIGQQQVGEQVARLLMRYGFAAAPVVAAALVTTRADYRGRMAPVLARIFAPLVLGVLVLYLGVALSTGSSPYSDRDTLIGFNVMLLFVLAVILMALAERPAGTAAPAESGVHVALIVLALAIDLIALSALGIRVGSYGVSPNRLAALGANLLIFVHLVGILYYYVHVLLGRTSAEQLEVWVARYLPVYVTWIAFVAFGFPLLFGVS